MTPFEIFAAALVVGTVLEAGALVLCALCRRGTLCLPYTAQVSWVSWCSGVAILLCIAAYDRDPTLFAGQVLAAWAFWKNGLLDVA